MRRKLNNVINYETKNYRFNFTVVDEEGELRPVVIVWNKNPKNDYEKYNPIIEYWDFWDRYDIIDDPEIEENAYSLFALWYGF